MQYQVQFAAPAGYLFTTQDVGSDTSDSDANTSTGKTQIVTLASGEYNPTLDAGVYQTASLGDRLWVDTNHNGQQDDGATGISGQTVTLIGGGADGLINGVGDTTATTVTGVDGFYQFTGLTPGVQYQVKFAAPAGYAFTTQDVGPDVSDSDANASTGKTQIITLTSGEYNPTLDAGVSPLGIDVEKYVRGVYTVQSGGGGEGLTPGFWKNHSIYGNAPHEEWTATGYSPDQSYEAVFGIIKLGANPTGTDALPTLLDALNTGGGGVNALLRHSTAALLNAADPNVDYLYSQAQIISMTQTAINSGDAALIESTKNLFAAQNELGADLSTPAGGTTTTTTDDFDADTSGSGPIIPLGGTAIFTYFVTNTGYTPLTISDVNGLVDDNGTPGNTADDFNFTYSMLSPSFKFHGVTYNAGNSLLFADGKTYSVGDVNGNHLLDTNEIWVYTHSETVQTTNEHVNIATVIGTDTSSGNSASDHDAAYYNTPGLTQSLGDFVWLDSNANGIQDSGELGIAGVHVKLFNASNVQVGADAITDSDGLYLFDNIPTGTYHVQFVAPAGLVFSTPNVGVNDSIDSDANALGNTIQTYTLTAGQQNPTVDAGLYALAALGDFVWIDANHNGKQDSGEAGIVGATVKLIGAGVDGIFGTGDDAVLATTTTGAGGLYHFTGLTPGQYQVQFVAPTGYLFTTQDVGANAFDTIDSDANTSTGKSQVVTLVSGQTNNTIDAGLYKPAALGDYVWDDANGNGIQDAGEAGIVGATVKLIGAGVDGIFGTGDDATLGTTTTGAGGIYHFTGLTPGQYQVQFVAPSGFVFTTPNAGSDDTVDSDANTSTGKTQVVTLASGQTDNTIDAGLHHVTDFTPDVFDGTIGFWKNHQEAWNGSTADNSAVAGLVSSGVLSKYDVLPTGVDSNGDGKINDADKGVLLGDMNANGKTDAGETTLFVPLAAAQYIIDPNATSSDTRFILMRQAIAAQLNVDNGQHEPNDVLSEAVHWLRGQSPFTYTDGTTGKIGNGDSVLQNNEYTISGGVFSFNAGALGSGSQAWTQDVDVYGGSNANDWDNNPSLAGNQEANGQDIKNALQSFNMGQLVTSLDGSQVGLYNGVFVDFAHANTADSFWLTLHDGGLI